MPRFQYNSKCGKESVLEDNKFIIFLVFFWSSSIIKSKDILIDEKYHEIYEP